MKWNIRLLCLFVGIQLASLVLSLVGYPLLAILASAKLWTTTTGSVSKWKFLDQIYGNARDGLSGTKSLTPWNAFVWSALRNSTNNFDALCTRPGHPLYYRTATKFGKQFYFKAGWLSDGYPCLSAGAGRGY